LEKAYLGLLHGEAQIINKSYCRTEYVRALAGFAFIDLLWRHALEASFILAP
jgi:hypothetical protein